MCMMFIGMLIMSVGKSIDNGDTTDEYKQQIERALSAALEKDKYPEINSLIENYLIAQVNCDLDALSLYVNDISNYGFEELQKKLTYVEYFDNISCYTIEGYDADTYVVYVYKEYKLKGIDTLIPSVVLNYVCKNSDGNYVVYTGEISSATNDFINATEKNPNVLELIEMVNSKIEKIKKDDEEVKMLLEQLDLVAINVENGDYQTPYNANE